jgi:hypothetical protein
LIIGVKVNKGVPKKEARLTKRRAEGERVARRYLFASG